MPQFIRADIPGATYFFTVNTYARRRLFEGAVARGFLREAIERTRAVRRFEIDAFVLLPDHLHCLWTLPEGDHDFSTRWRKIKECFTRLYIEHGGTECGIPPGQLRKGQRGVWQQRFWEHVIRDDVDYENHMNYIHFNPVKHDYVPCAHAWSWSTFHKWVKRGAYDRYWCCSCDNRDYQVPDFEMIREFVAE